MLAVVALTGCDVQVGDKGMSVGVARETLNKEWSRSYPLASWLAPFRSRARRARRRARGAHEMRRAPGSAPPREPFRALRVSA
jgi:hypothetical protein